MRYNVAISVIFIALGSGSLAKPLEANTREHVVAGMTGVMNSWDKDGNRKLSRAEVAVMVDEFLRRSNDATEGKMTAVLEKQRQELLGFYARQDANGDGFLSLDELLEGPLATFDCMDANDDGKVSQDEVFSGMQRCPSANFDDHAPKA